MTTHTDAKGDQYQFHSGYVTGDVVLLSEDKRAFKVEKSSLADASPVFRDMFANDSLKGAEVHLPATSSIINTFLALLIRPSCVNIYSWREGIETISFARQYECLAVARLALYACSLIDPGDEYRIEAFILAYELNDHLSACRQLAKANDGEKTIYGTVTTKKLPYPRARALSLRPSSGTWRPHQIARLSSIWLWALTRALELADERQKEKLDRTSEGYWSAVVGEFMVHVTKCKFSLA